MHGHIYTNMVVSNTCKNADYLFHE